MGAHYSSIQVRSDNREAVKAAVEAVASESGKKFLLGPVLDGWTGVYPDDSGRDEECTAALAKRVDTVVLYLQVHDSDIFSYNFFRNGRLLNEYCSNPDYFEEVPVEERERLRARPEWFAELVASPENVETLSRLLAEMEFVVEEERLEKFAELVGIRNTLTSYRYLKAGEHDGVKGWKEFVHIPDLSGEKAAKKAAEAELRSQLQQLQKKGLLCIECLPPGNKRQRLASRGDLALDPTCGGVLVLWRNFLAPRKPPQLVRLQSPWKTGQQLVPMTFASTEPGALVVSKSGRWMALYDGQMKLWDSRRQPLDIGDRREHYPVLFSNDEEFLLCKVPGGIALFSAESLTPIHHIKTNVSTGKFALHPSNKFIVAATRQERLGIFNLQSGVLEKELFCGARIDMTGLAPIFEDKLRQGGVSESDLAQMKEGLVRGSFDPFKMEFSPDGKMLFCATSAGVQILDWNELIKSENTTPQPLFASMPARGAGNVLWREDYQNDFTYDISFDSTAKRLIFAGLGGRIHFLNLQDGSTGILLDPPGKFPIVRLELSADREFVSCLCTNPRLDREQTQCWRVQVWNYTALCKAAGLD